MSYQYLDPNGLTTLWGIIKNKFGQVDGIFLGGSGATAGITNKMATIQTFNPSNLTVPGLVPVPGTPSSQVFLSGDGNWRTPPGTTSVATTAADGLMSSTDKIKLNSVASSAQVNQDAFSYIVVGGSTVAADDKKDKLTLVGAGSVSLGVNTGTDTITITGSTSVATTAANGLMSAADKIKINSLDGDYVPIQNIGAVATATIGYAGDMSGIELGTQSTWSGINQTVSLLQGQYPIITIQNQHSDNNYSVITMGQSDRDAFISARVKYEGSGSSAGESFFNLSSGGIFIGAQTTSRVHITQLVDPTNEEDAANKRYVDASNIIEKIQKNGTDLTITNKTVNIGVPTSTSQLSNDSGFITTADIPQGAAGSTTTPKMDGTAAVGTELAFARGDHVHPTDTSRAPLASPQFTGTPGAPTAAVGTASTQIATTAFVNTAITNALADITGIEYEVVQSLPATGEVGVIYLISNSGTTPNIYDEYIWIGTAFEKIGTTDVDLSGYVQDTDLVAITTAEIEAICI